MTPLSNNFTVSLAAPTRPASAPRPAPEFVVEVAQDGFQGSVVQGIAVDKDILQAQPVIVEAQPEIIQARPETPDQSPCQLTDPPHEDGWYLSH